MPRSVFNECLAAITFSLRFSAPSVVSSSTSPSRSGLSVTRVFCISRNMRSASATPIGRTSRNSAAMLKHVRAGGDGRPSVFFWPPFSRFFRSVVAAAAAVVVHCFPARVWKDRTTWWRAASAAVVGACTQ